MKKLTLPLTLLLAAAVAVSCAKKQEEVAPPETTAPPAAVTHPNLKVTPEHTTKMAKATPGKDAKKAKSIGAGETTVTTVEDADVWTEQTDVDGDGDMETVDYLWDGATKVLYCWMAGQVQMVDGTWAQDGAIVAIYNEGNTAGQPVGSGWYAYGVRSGDSTQVVGELWGCYFDAAGNATQCGTAAWDRTANSITIAAAPTN
jgi:hypothetical protein